MFLHVFSRLRFLKSSESCDIIISFMYRQMWNDSPSYFPSLMKMKNFRSMKLKLNVARRVVTFYFLLGSSIQCLLSAGIWSYFTQRDVSRKMWQMYLSIVEEYFSVEATHNLRIGLMNKHSTQKVVLLILPSFLNVIFSLVFMSKTDWCFVSRLLYHLMVCFQIIVPQYYNYDM